LSTPSQLPEPGEPDDSPRQPEPPHGPEAHEQPEPPSTSLPDDAPIMSDDELAEAKRYGRLDLACSLVDKGLDLAYLAVMALLLARPIDEWLAEFPALAAQRWLRLVVMLLIVTGLHVCVSFPLSYYSGYVLEHRFGLSKQTLARWLWRYAKRVAVGGAFGVVMFLGLFWLIWTTGAYWWLVGAGAFFLVSVVLGQLAPVLILPLFYKIRRLDNPELADRLARLAQGTGLSLEGVYRMELSAETVKANAMLAGLGRTRRVLLGDTLLDHFSPDEIEVIFAHEVGHHVFGHVRKMIVAGLVYSAAGFWICDRLLAAWADGPAGRFDYAQTPVWALPLLMLVLTVFALVLGPLQNFVSRRYERQSDRYALERTGLKEAYRSAYRKLAQQNKDDPEPPRLEVVLFHSHPPIAERLQLAEKH
jgi:STE24 endopeptidase